MIFDLDEIGTGTVKPNKESDEGLSLSQMSTSLNQKEQPPSVPVAHLASPYYVKVIMTKTEITHLRDGREFCKSTSWIVGNQPVIRKEKKTKELTEVKEQEAEEY